MKLGIARRLRRQDRGQALVEFALVAPILLFLLLGIACSGALLRYTPVRTDIVQVKELAMGLWTLTPVTIAVPDNVTVITGDVADLETHLDRLGQTRFDVVLSDMAPATTGNRHVDEARSVGLCEAALYIAEKTLVPGGSFVCKIFQGGDTKAFTDAVRNRFHRQTAFRPKSTRKASREVFVIGLQKKET